MTNAGKSTLVGDSPVTGPQYGGFPYGLELLTLPPAGLAQSSTGPQPEAVGTGDIEHLLRQLDALAMRGASSRSPGGFEDARTGMRAASREQISWFRWITGHQVAFVLWNLMGRLLDAAPDPGALDPPSLAKLETYADGYCAMLLYTGSCPPDLYESLIRPRMFLQHPAFSGTWAPDFVRVRSLFRGRDLARLARPGAAGLIRAVEFSKRLHDGVAARLVPEGRSLLQESVAVTPIRLSRRTALLYDNFFMTLRAPLGLDGVVAQLLRRLGAVALDLAANDLYPHQDVQADERPEELRGEEVRACEDGIGDLLLRIGTAAAGTA